MFGGSFSILHWIVVLAVVLLLFGGRGKVSAIMGDFGKGLRNFKTGLKGPEAEDEATEAIEDAPRPAKKAAAKKSPAKKKAPAKKAAAKKAPAKKASAKKAASKKASAKK